VNIEHACLGQNVGAPIRHADTDKPHRCPACWAVASYGERFPWKRQDGTAIRWWRCYRCACCGQRFARWTWLPDGALYRFLHYSAVSTWLYRWLRCHDRQGGWRCERWLHLGGEHR